MKLKKKKIRLWCPGGGKDIGFQFSKESRKLSLTPALRKTRFVRCGVCDQRFEVQNKDCHDFGCTHSFVPKHKAY